jgi:hypothetical protein
MSDCADDRISAPWDDHQVASLNGYQASGAGHEFTCGNGDCREALEAIPAGWKCPRCGCTQNWAWRFMTDGSWRGPGPWPLIVFSGMHGDICRPRCHTGSGLAQPARYVYSERELNSSMPRIRRLAWQRGFFDAPGASGRDSRFSTLHTGVADGALSPGSRVAPGVLNLWIVSV